MFDRVRIRAVPATSASGHAGLEGMVHGVTTPSVTGVEVIGEHEDVALCVDFEDAASMAWFAPHLVERLDHGAGLELEIEGESLVRTGDGTWVEKTRRPWWRFW